MTNANSDQPVTFSLRLPTDLADEIDRLAAKQKRSRSNMVRLLLAQVLRGDAASKPAA